MERGKDHQGVVQQSPVVDGQPLGGDPIAPQITDLLSRGGVLFRHLDQPSGVGRVVRVAT